MNVSIGLAQRLLLFCPPSLSPYFAADLWLPTTKKLMMMLSFLLLLLLSPAAAAADDEPSVHELLPKFGLPTGLLPDSVIRYSLADDGTFLVELQEPCYLQFDYLVYYEKKITGVLKYGSITGLQGIQVKKLFFWLDVDEIRVDLPPSDSIYFVVGWITRKLPVSQFQSVRRCSLNSQVSDGLKELMASKWFY